jgi:ubiquinone/menaquinone biosynthesis C-methylase UbiE
VAIRDANRRPSRLSTAATADLALGVPGPDQLARISGRTNCKTRSWRTSCGRRHNARMTETGKVGTGAEDYDAAHRGHDASPLLRRLWSQAMGEEYPAEVEPLSSCSWLVLGHMVAALRVPVGGLLVDLGCGRGGVGLWLARAFGARLVGVDHSAAAVEIARRRAADFGLGEVEFRRATFDATGLPDDAADGVVSMDALPFADDRVAALRELRRILAPGGRAVITARKRRAGEDGWEALGSAAGLTTEQVLVNPHHDEHWRRLYALWLSHEKELRAEMGDRATDNLIREANEGPSRLGDRPALLLVFGRSADA